MPTAGSPYDPAEDMVDWSLAVATAGRLLRPGPQIGRDEAAAVVAELRQRADEAERHVRAHTGLSGVNAPAPVIVVDRPGWVQANVDGFRTVLSPLVERLRERRESAGWTTAVGSRVTGVEAGALLAFLAGKVLGQFDPFWSPPPQAADWTTPPAGRLLLVAPNVVQVERELTVNPRDFRLWVCLHEETHRVQFGAAPWLRGHILGLVESFFRAASLDPGAVLALVRDAVERVGRSARERQGFSVLDLVQTPEQRETLEQVTAVMSLLEGHADVVMDGVGPEVVPTVATIRERFQRRRAGGSPLDLLLKRVLGLDAKLRQYRDGARFVRGVLDRVGMAGLNAVWTGPRALPERAEVADPAAWVARVHGS